jgi:hypothetical protein
MTRAGIGMSEPPEGVLAGESVPPGSEPDEFDREKLEKVKNELKARLGNPRSMSEEDFEEKAKEIIEKAEGK